MWYILAQSVDGLRRSADQNLFIAELIAWGACAIIPLMLFYNAYKTLKNGFTINKITLHGTPAKVVAAILVLAGIGVIVVGVMVLPNFSF